MDHADAVRLQAAEKYVLGELSGDLREAYEEHYFDCAECAFDVKAAAMFVEGARELAKDRGQDAVPARIAETTKPTWLDRVFGSWLRPVIAVPALAILLAAVIYQNAVTIPALRSGSDSSTGTARVYRSSFSLMGANVRGGAGVAIAVHPKEGFLLDFDFTPSASANSYLAQLQDASGKVLLQNAILGSDANQSLHFAVPAGTLTGPGEYSLVFYAAKGDGSRPSPTAEVQRLTFQVAFQR